MSATPTAGGGSWKIIRRSPRSPAPNVSDDGDNVTMACCMPIFRRRRSSRSEKDSTIVSQSTSSTTGGADTDLIDESPLKESKLSSSKGSRSRRSSGDFDADTEWHSAVSSMSYIEDLVPSRPRASSVTLSVPLSDAEKATGWEALPQLPKSQWPPCTCGFPCHSSTFDTEIPLFTPPGVVPGSYEEALTLAKAAVGNWTTILTRSDSLDPQMVHLGIGRIKRGVMNRLAVPLSARLEDGDLVLHAQIHTPLGPKSMHAHLLGKEMIDDDSDCGKWTGVAKVVDFSDPRFCSGRPVRAVQLLRKNPKFGICFETRAVVPDLEEGKVMLFNLSLFPMEKEKAPIIVTRIMKFSGPL